MRELPGVMARSTILMVVMVSEVSTYVKTYQMMYFNYIRLTVYQLYLNRT